MRALPCLLLGFALIGCDKYKQEDFSEAFAENACRAYEDCDVLSTLMGYASYAECAVELEAKVDPDEGKCPEYDEELAFACVKALATQDCAAVLAGEWPTECDDACPDGSAGAPEPRTADDAAAER